MDALRAFMDGLIDYAGLFPPASLSMPEAVREYGHLRREEEAWMLGRFILPVGRLGELEAEIGAGEPPWRLSVIVDASEAVVSRQSRRVVIESAETRIPPTFLATKDPSAIAEHAATLEVRLAEAGFAALPVFFEGGDDDSAPTVIRTIAERRRAGAPDGFKLRCAGPRAEDTPPVEHVAAVIEACHSAGVPLKLTAGLHHALRSHIDPPGGWQHGFLNVVSAGILMAAGRLDREGCRACLLDENGDNFRLDQQLSWKGRAATPAEIAVARRKLMVGFGSCSFAEPRDDLVALGLLP